ncbi:E3 ubiquitin-protein ligase RNF180-like [Zootermopsis nevadensis]|uniref:E3 ubiquitin-protein ligase RNF180-like n=1 Tax=Zootermopsis nevadensis TaxID=136037 RepID=UPI000B8EBE6C|nr:E3 ubiquitin-protein ligase RNF180-like [Zootermopsis nevadensis]
MSLKCRQCRHVLVTQDDRLLTPHGEPVGAIQGNSGCATLEVGDVMYLQEDLLPTWIAALVNKEGWVKGRLHCPKCHSRVGGFDFVSGQKCACGLCVLPAVHLVRSKMDQAVNLCKQHE